MNLTATTRSERLAPRGLRAHVKVIHEKVGAFLAERGNGRLRTLWPEWDRRFRELFEQTGERPEVPISLVGGTGAGKSTLLNALIGARVLPVNDMRACTAAICEVSYADGPYRALVEFVPRQSWEHEVQLLLAELQDTQDISDEDGTVDPRILSRAVRQKLWTVYRPSEHGDFTSFDPLRLIEPPEIKAALDSGTTEIESLDLKEFRSQISRYLDAQHRFWPIVKSVSVSGPFTTLRDGAKIIDLPGINDANEVREAVTKKHLKTCRFLWLVFNMKRGLTKDIIDLMQSEDFLRQVVMDGRSDSLTFVGTAADDADRQSGIDQFGLEEDATIEDVVAARNQAVRKLVLDQLDEFSCGLATLAGEQADTAKRLAAHLKASKIFTVSARESMRMEGIAKTQSVVLSDPQQTEVPALRAHMHDICFAHGVTAHHRGIERQLELLLNEIQGELQFQQAMLTTRAEVSERGRKEMRAAVDAARSFLERELVTARDRLVQDLEAGQKLLGERVTRAVERARHDLDETIARWERMHHLTIRAVCRRGGTHIGTQRSDFPAELSKPILDGIAFAWSDFFGERLRQILEKWTDRLRHHAVAYRVRLEQSLTADPDISANQVSSLVGMFETTEKVLHELLAQASNQMESKIQHEQRTLYESVPEQMKANMQCAFRVAAEASGAGMKRRMIDILGQHARKVSQVMFDDARDALLSGVRNLNDWLTREYEKMTKAVEHNASLAAENIVASGERMSAAAIATEHAMLTDFDALLMRLREEPLG